jgi:hypothetical protein
MRSVRRSAKGGSSSRIVRANARCVKPLTVSVLSGNRR